MKRPLADKRPIGPFSQLFIFSANTDCGSVSNQLSKVGNIEEVTNVGGACIIDFHLPIEPTRDLASSIVVEDGNKVDECTLRFPVVEEEDACKGLDVSPDGSNFRNSHAIRTGVCNPHLELESQTDLAQVLESIEKCIEIYESKFDMSDRIAEEDIEINF